MTKADVARNIANMEEYKEMKKGFFADCDDITVSIADGWTEWTGFDRNEKVVTYFAEKITGDECDWFIDAQYQTEEYRGHFYL